MCTGETGEPIIIFFFTSTHEFICSVHKPVCNRLDTHCASQLYFLSFQYHSRRWNVRCVKCECRHWTVVDESILSVSASFLGFVSCELFVSCSDIWLEQVVILRCTPASQCLCSQSGGSLCYNNILIVVKDEFCSLVRDPFLLPLLSSSILPPSFLPSLFSP